MAELAIIEKWAENLDEVTVSRWLVREGDAVEAGDGLCEIITDKATFEYEVQSSGIVKAIYAPPRSTVPVGYVIAFIGGPDEEPPDDVERRNARVMEEHRRAAEEELELDLDLPERIPSTRREGRERRQKVRGTPAARRLARDRDVTLDEVAAALDVSGVVTEEHVRAYLAEE
ncbi:MAG: biotin/lipoyl-containing protein [Armatimonadota bacterium]|nr:biotin/lipoyl-containing protein [Armatimonadota bacterium]